MFEMVIWDLAANFVIIVVLGFKGLQGVIPSDPGGGWICA